jgi:hypothetical protein
MRSPNSPNTNVSPHPCGPGMTAGNTAGTTTGSGASGTVGSGC